MSVMQWKRPRRRVSSRRQRPVLGGPSEMLEPRILLATSLIKDINTIDTQPANLTGANGTAYFTVTNSSNGTDLYKACGSGPAALVKGFPSYGSLDGSIAVGATLYFSTNDPTNGRELWKSDGTAAGTVMVKDINPGLNGSSPSNLAAVGATLYFSANDGTHGTELWKSDGTAAGTVMVKDITPGLGGQSPQNLTPVGATLFFTTADASFRASLWKSDGTDAGTVLVDPGDLSGESASNLAAVGSTLYFTTGDFFSGRELWVSDGTPAGTVMLKDVNPGPTDSHPRSLTAVGSALFFVADDGTNGSALWKSDGTAAGTVLVKDVNPGTDSYSGPSYLTAAGTTLFFVADDGTHDAELWRSDGTAAGTMMVKDINPSPFGTSHLTNLKVLGSTLVLVADDGTSGAELWRSDGTEAGTVLVKDINSGAIGSLAGLSYKGFQVENGLIYFTANSNTGQQFYRSDGTTSGTVAIDVGSTILNSTITLIGSVNNGVFVVANDGVHGYEPYLIGNSPVPNQAPTVNSVADLATGINRTLSIPVVASDPDAGQTLTYSLDVAIPGASIDAGTGVVTFKPKQAGTYHLLVRATDSGLPAQSVSTTITVVASGTVPSDSDGDGKTDLAVYRPSQALWIVRYSGGGSLAMLMGDPSAGDIAAQSSPYFQRRSRTVAAAAFADRSAPSANFDLSAPASPYSVAALTTPPGLVPQPSRVATTTAYRPQSDSIAIDGTNT